MVPIDASRLRSELLEPSGPYAALDVVASTGSTNADLRATVAEGAPDRSVLIAEEQTAGVGRRSRAWSSPKGTGLYISVLLRPSEVSFANLGSLSVVAGLAVIDMVTELGAEAVLKWPNDVLDVEGRGKCAGILAEAAPADEVAVVLGMGLNIAPLRESLEPGPAGLRPVSLAELGARTSDRTQVGSVLLAALARRERAWRAAAGNLERAGLLEAYRGHCSTIGADVKVAMSKGSVTGRAVDVDAGGQLLVAGADGATQTIFAGDVVHLRSLGPRS